MLFISSKKLFSFSKYLSFYHDFLVMYKNWLDQKEVVNKQLQYTYCRKTNMAEKLIPDLFLSFKYAKYEVKASGLQLSFNVFP